AQGSKLTDTAGNEYIDYIGSWGPAILGHAHPKVVQAVQQAAEQGLSFGAPTLAEVELAEELSQRIPSLEMIRCVSSGTEATMSALRLARGYTGRSVIVKFDGCYHGHSDGLLVQAGSGAATFGEPDSAGVPPEVVQHTLSLPYNDIGALASLFEKRGTEIAAVIVEPVVGNMGCVPPSPGFLESIIELCRDHGALSIFDEVMTGCRLSPAGAQGLYDLRPDLSCFGKVVGGGLPLAVYGGRRDIMEKIAPLGPVYQAGTLSGNPLSVAAARTTLACMGAEEYATLERRGAQLEAGLVEVAGQSKEDICIQRVGSMITLFFAKGPILNWIDSSATDKEKFAAFHQGMLAKGIYWPPSAFEAAFLSVAHSKEDIDQTIEAAGKTLNSL
ncbi:MAG: glutamate-1-semialdehyde 2,1-aminomutase, partial [Polyangiaceae bacterium]|nr:glutamate-1-semialdehyde 2,1-aminomutase [Polyangiaceae bacterium]